jgi:hypothetical protein
LPDLAAELVRLKVDVIVVSPTPAAVAAKNATGTAPSSCGALAILLGWDSSRAWRARGETSPGCPSALAWT